MDLEPPISYFLLAAAPATSPSPYVDGLRGLVWGGGGPSLELPSPQKDGRVIRGHHGGLRTRSSEDEPTSSTEHLFFDTGLLKSSPEVEFEGFNIHNCRRGRGALGV